MTELEFVNDIAMFFFVITFLFLTLFLLSICEFQQRITDRYRLKYGFDREIEKKEPKGFNDSDSMHEAKLDKREQRFKRRVFKD